MTDTDVGEGTHSSTHRSRSMRVAFWLAALAIIPLLGASWFALAQLTHVDRSRSQAEVVAASSDQLIAATELRARLLDELNWSSTQVGISNIGIDPALVIEVISIDIAHEITRAREAVDARLAELDWAAIGPSVELIRNLPEPTFENLEQSYGALLDEVTVRADLAFDEILIVAGEMHNASNLLASLRVLDAASEARQAVTLQHASYFGSQFLGVVSASADFRTLIEQTGVYHRAIAEIERIAAPDSRVLDVLETVRASPDVESFDEATQALLLHPPTPTNSDGLDIPAILAQLPQISEAFTSGAGSVEAHIALVRAAGEDVQLENNRVGNTARSETQTALITVLLLAVASFVFTIVSTRAVGRPLRLLASSARELRDGRTTTVTPSGPREVREAMTAINEAAAHIELAERQASALARGELSSPALTETATGALGTSLQQAVKTLAQSMSEGGEFRRRLTHEATHDSLTGLANRRASLDHLRRALARVSRSDQLVALMFLDLDGFKDINDQHGHRAGDQVLQEVGQRLHDAVRGGDVAGRLGGDEFVIITEALTEAEAALRLARRLIGEVEKPILLDSTTVSVTASVGIALADATNRLMPGEMLRDADLAVYKAKQLGRAHIELCDEELRAELHERSTTEEALRAAIDSDELSLHFQPIVDATSLDLVGLEALIRWERPGVGAVSPGDFIPIAERSDLISAVDAWVIGRAIEQIDEWRNGRLFADVPISINISARSVLDTSLVEMVRQKLTDRDVPASRIVLEVTESALVLDLDRAAKNLAQLRAMGVQVAIDDFGTGYTSLAHLRTWPVDILKIDRAFVANESETPLVKLIVEMGHLLGARVVAEGIETQEQAANLTALGADELQGFYYGRPATADAIVNAFAAAVEATAAATLG